MLFDYFAYIAYTSMILSAIINALLIYLGLKVYPRTTDIKLIIALASTEYMTCLVGLPDIIYSAITGERLIDNPLGCQYIGCMMYLVFSCEIALSTVLAIVRYSKIYQKKLKNIYFVPIFIYQVLLIILLIWSCASFQMRASSSRIICVLYANTSVLSAFTFHYIIIGFLIGVLIASFCYYKLVIKVVKVTIIENTEPEVQSTEIDTKYFNYKIAVIRIYSLLIIIILSMLFSLLFFFLENLFDLIYGDSLYHDTLIYFNQTAEMLFMGGILTNSILLLFLHTGINAQLNAWIISFKCKS